MLQLAVIQIDFLEICVNFLICLRICCLLSVYRNRTLMSLFWKLRSVYADFSRAQLTFIQDSSASWTCSSFETSTLGGRCDQSWMFDGSVQFIYWGWLFFDNNTSTVLIIIFNLYSDSLVRYVIENKISWAYRNSKIQENSRFHQRARTALLMKYDFNLSSIGSLLISS